MMAEETVQLTCPICAKTFEPSPKEAIPYATKHSDTDKVTRPRMIFFSPYTNVGIAYPQLSEADLSRYYEQGDYWQSKKVRIFTPRTSPGLYAMAESRWLTAEPFLTAETKNAGLSILDIGGGHGYFGMAAVHSAKARLKEYAVAEMDGFFRQSLQKTWAARFPRVSFRVEDDVAKFQCRFDLVVLSHVLEHLNDPRAMLRQAIERMDADGVLFIDVPHEDFRFKKDVFPHVLFYNPSSLRQLVESVGLKVLSVSCYGKDMRFSPMNHLNEKNSAALISKVLYKTRHIWPAAMLTKFYTDYFGADKENANGTWVRLIAKRQERT